MMYDLTACSPTPSECVPHTCSRKGTTCNVCCQVKKCFPDH